mgnify:FL=1
MPTISFASIIAECESPKGHAYYPFYGAIPKDKSGWDTDGFSTGVYRLILNNDQSFDVVFSNSNGQYVSALQDGAEVMPFSMDENQISLMVVYMGNAIEVFSFVKDNAGNKEIIFTQIKTGMIPKVAAYRGRCSKLEI